jgi:amino acid transporter
MPWWGWILAALAILAVSFLGFFAAVCFRDADDAVRAHQAPEEQLPQVTCGVVTAAIAILLLASVVIAVGGVILHQWFVQH